MKGSFYIFTLPRDYHRGMPSIERVNQYINVEDMIGAAVHSVAEYVGHYNQPILDLEHYHRYKSNMEIEELIQTAAIHKYEEEANSCDMPYSTSDVADHIRNVVQLPYNEIRNHLIYMVLQLRHSQLVREPYEHAMAINWLSPSEFVVVIDPSEGYLPHVSSYLNSDPIYV